MRGDKIPTVRGNRWKFHFYQNIEVKRVLTTSRPSELSRQPVSICVARVVFPELVFFTGNSSKILILEIWDHLVLILSYSYCCVFQPAFGCWAYPKAGWNIFFMPFSTFFVNFKPFSVISRLKSTYFWTRVKLNVTIVKQIMLIFVIDF